MCSVRFGRILWISIIIEFSPAEEGTTILPRNIAGMAHPKVTPEVFLLLLDHPQHTRYSAVAFGGATRMHVGFVVSIRDIDPLTTRDRMRIDRWGRCHAVLPLFLHLCMHDQQ